MYIPNYSSIFISDKVSRKAIPKYLSLTLTATVVPSRQLIIFHIQHLLIIGSMVQAQFGEPLLFRCIITFMGIFVLGGVVFIVTFILFKISAFKKTSSDQSWKKLAAVTIVDYLVLVAGTLVTGILFMTFYSIAHT